MTARGYVTDFRAVEGGLLAAGTPCVHAPEDLVIDEVARFEGVSDPDDQTIIFALRCERHAARGTYAPAYGPAMDALDAEMVRRLGARR